MNTNNEIFEARLGNGLPMVEAAATGAMPADIQWMPPGRHTINALKNGKPATLTVTVNAAVAQRMNDALQAFRAKANSGEEDLPYFDINHDDDAASGYPTEFFWGGDDAKSGGVRAKVEWSEAGKAAVTGKTHRRFSPTFQVNASGEVIAAGVNLGGLVTRAAFKKISAIWSRHGGGDETVNKQNNMTDKELADLTATIAAIGGDIKDIKAKQGDLLKLETRIAGLEEAGKIQAKDRAQAIVAKHVARGAIPPQNKELIGKWEARLVSDPSASDLLDALPDNPALAVITGKGGNGGGGAAAGTDAEKFVAEVKAKAVEMKDQGKALDFVIDAKPELYQAWRDANGKPGLN